MLQALPWLPSAFRIQYKVQLEHIPGPVLRPFFVCQWHEPRLGSKHTQSFTSQPVQEPTNHALLPTGPGPILHGLPPAEGKTWYLLSAKSGKQVPLQFLCLAHFQLLIGLTGKYCFGDCSAGSCRANALLPALVPSLSCPVDLQALFFVSQIPAST